MEQIRFRLGLRPRPRCGSLQCSPRSLAGLRGLFLKGGRRGEGNGEKEGKKRECGRRGKEVRGEPTSKGREGKERREEEVREGSKRSVPVVPNLPLHHC